MKAAIGLVCLSLLAAWSRAQTFRADVHLVNVSFSVRNGQGKFVTDLTADDFELLEDGVPQKISFFAKSVDVPLTLGLVVDISGSQGSFMKSHEKDLRSFLKNALGPKDQAFLVAFGNRIRLVADYSSPDRDLATALAGFEQANKNPYPELGPPEIRTGGTAFYDAIYHSATQMLGRTDGQRRALIVFSDGEDNSSAHHMLETIEAAQTNNVSLFCVRYTEAGRGGQLTARNKYGTGVMARIAKETGGADFNAREKDMSENFRQIGDQLRSAYELGFHTSNPTSDDTFHKIAIRPKDLTLRVRAKTGYYSR